MMYDLDAAIRERGFLSKPVPRETIEEVLELAQRAQSNCNVQPWRVYFGIGVALDVGMYVQTLMLAMQSRGIGSCAQAALRAYPELVAQQLGIPDDEQILCGLSFGHEDLDVPANRTRQPRDPISSNVFFIGDAD